LILPAGAPHKG